MTAATVTIPALALALLAATLPAAARHLGSYIPQDNEISANFKQLRFSIQAGRFDVAQRLFEGGAVRNEMQALAGALPGLEEATRRALAARDARAAERALAVLFAALVRNLALEADRQLADGDAGAAVARAGVGLMFLAAMWRYYNLIDFVVSQDEPRASTAVRLAFDEAERYAAPPGPAARRGAARTGAAPTAAQPAATRPDPEQVRVQLRVIEQTLARVIDALSPSTRRSP